MSLSQLNNDIHKAVENWNERDSFTLKGVKNLSRADIDMVQLYAHTYERYGYFKDLMPPRGEVKDVLSAYSIGTEEIGTPDLGF